MLLRSAHAVENNFCAQSIYVSASSYPVLGISVAKKNPAPQTEGLRLIEEY